MYSYQRIRVSQLTLTMAAEVQALFARSKVPCCASLRAVFPALATIPPRPATLNPLVHASYSSFDGGWDGATTEMIRRCELAVKCGANSYCIAAYGVQHRSDGSIDQCFDLLIGFPLPEKKIDYERNLVPVKVNRD